MLRFPETRAGYDARYTPSLVFIGQSFGQVSILECKRSCPSDRLSIHTRVMSLNVTYETYL